jgi:hypothetical protein
LQKDGNHNYDVQIFSSNQFLKKKTQIDIQIFMEIGENIDLEKSLYWETKFLFEENLRRDFEMDRYNLQKQFLFSKFEAKWIVESNKTK